MDRFLFLFLAVLGAAAEVLALDIRAGIFAIGIVDAQQEYYCSCDCEA
jgi:hypothetical protein